MGSEFSTHMRPNVYKTELTKEFHHGDNPGYLTLPLFEGMKVQKVIQVLVFVGRARWGEVVEKRLVQPKCKYLTELMEECD